MTKQLYRARISLTEMEKDYTVPTTSQANKKTPSLYTFSNVVAHKIEINTTKSISKLQTENIKNQNIKNTSGDDAHGNKEIEYVKIISVTSTRNRAAKKN